MIPRNKTGTVLILTLILAGAAFLRLHRLGDRPLYFDEPHHTVIPALLPLPEIVRTNYGSVLYPVLVHVLLPAGPVEAMARLPAAVFGILAVAALYLVGLRIFGRKEAAVAAFLAATSGPFIYFSQQARAYTGLLLFSLLALYFFLRAAEDGRWTDWAGYVVSMVVGVYLHFFQLILFPVHGLALVLWTIARRRQKVPGPDPERPSVLRPLIGFAAAAAVTLAATYLLYLPTRNVSAGEVSFFSNLEISIRGLIGGRPGIPLGPFIRETFPRLLDYQVWPFWFFVKILLAAAGLAACRKGKSRELVLFLIYIILPFLLFVFSNPADVYKSGQDNKFIFLTPILFLLMARGFSAIDDFAVRKKPARTVGRIAFAAAVILGEGAGLLEYRQTQWEGMSLRRNRETVSAMARNLESEVLVFSDGTVNPPAFVFAIPIDIPGTQRKGVMFYEAGGGHFHTHHDRPMDIWAILRTTPLETGAAKRLEAASEHIKIKSFPPFTLVHDFDPDTSLLDKALRWTSFYKTLPIGDGKKRHIDLLQASMNLITGQNREALDILGSPELRLPDHRTVPPRRAAGPGRILSPRLNTSDDIERSFHENINFYLMHNARLALDRGDAETAVELLDGIMTSDPRFAEVRTAAHILRAEAFLAREKAEDAVREYASALVYAPSPDIEAQWIRKIGEIRDAPAGVLIRQSAREIHIRWWSEDRREFSGRIDISEPIAGIREFRLTEADRYRSGNNKLDFTGISRNGFVKGLTIVTKRPARGEIRIRVPGLRRLEDHLIVIPDPENPGGIVLR